MNILITFIILSIVNVIFSTIRSITTIKSGKITASLISGGYFAFYNIMLIWTVAEFPMWQKCLITFVCNVIGVWVVKFVEEKLRKDKLWEVRATIKSNKIDKIEEALTAVSIPYTATITNDEAHYIVNIYCETQKDSETVKTILNKYEAKYFVSESKTL